MLQNRRTFWNKEKQLLTSSFVVGNPISFQNSKNFPILSLYSVFFSLFLDKNWNFGTRNTKPQVRPHKTLFQNAFHFGTKTDGFGTIEVRGYFSGFRFRTIEVKPLFTRATIPCRFPLKVIAWRVPSHTCLTDTCLTALARPCVAGADIDHDHILIDLVYILCDTINIVHETPRQFFP